MRCGEQLPTVHEDALIKEALVEMTQKNLGMTSVIDHEKRLVGIYTDGDLRRTLNKSIDVHSTPIKVVMTKSCKTIPQHY